MILEIESALKGYPAFLALPTGGANCPARWPPRALRARKSLPPLLPSPLRRASAETPRTLTVLPGRLGGGAEQASDARREIYLADGSGERDGGWHRCLRGTGAIPTALPASSVGPPRRRLDRTRCICSISSLAEHFLSRHDPRGGTAGPLLLCRRTLQGRASARAEEGGGDTYPGEVPGPHSCELLGSTGGSLGPVPQACSTALRRGLSSRDGAGIW